MGSAKVNNVRPSQPMAENDKKSFITLVKNFFKDKKKEKAVKETKNIQNPPSIAVTPVADLIDNLQKLNLKKEECLKNEQKNKEENEEDEFKNFEIRIIEDDTRIDRLDSNSSEDSGFADNEKPEDLIVSLSNLKVDDKSEKKKKIQTVVVSRGPIRNRYNDFSSTHPYQVESDNSHHINQINRQALCGGQVTVKPNINTAILQVEERVKEHENSSPTDLAFDFELAVEFVRENSSNNALDLKDLDDIIQAEQNRIHNQDGYSDNTEYLFDGYSQSFQQDPRFEGYPTPPRSENAFSPMSDSVFTTSLNIQTPECSLSSDNLSPMSNIDHEKYQEIPQTDELPTSLLDNAFEVEKKKKERKNSSSSMTLKQFKDLQKDISAKFSKMECCQTTRKPCLEIFEDHLKKLQLDERKNVCLKVADLDLKTAYSVLQRILFALSSSSEQEDLHIVLFGLICERVLRETPNFFVGDCGLNLIKSSVLRCYTRPLLTRYMVQCVRKSLTHTQTSKEVLYHETDLLGDNLITACARSGDRCGDVLAELLRKEGDEIPLFDVHHANIDGYTPLHVACKEHSDASPRLHIVHVLLEHGNADIWRGDVKGGETGLHLAVHAAGVSLALVLLLFRSLERRHWKQLAHRQNRSSVTPLEYARGASKSATRQDYPIEVLEFLKKCR